MTTQAYALSSAFCPACRQPMAPVRTIWRAFQDDLEVWDCKACGASVAQTAQAAQMLLRYPDSARLN